MTDIVVHPDIYKVLQDQVRQELENLERQMRWTCDQFGLVFEEVFPDGIAINA